MAAEFVNQGRIDLMEMIKFKLLIWVFFLFNFQLSFSNTLNTDVVEIIKGCNTENQLQFEKTYTAHYIAGETPKNQFDSLDNLLSSKCFLPNSNSKDFQVSFVQIVLKYNAVERGLLSCASPCKRLFNIPIYLQTEKFRL